MEGKEALVLASADDFKLKAVNDVLQAKLVKRGVPLKALTYGKIEPAAGSTVRQRDHHAAGHPHREGARDREADQELKEESAGVDPGRFGARQRQGSRHTAGDHRPAQASRISASTCSSRTIASISRAFTRSTESEFTRNFDFSIRAYIEHTATYRDAKEVFDLLHDDLAAIEREFGRDTVSGVRAITEIGEYLRAGGGKRLRPALLLLSAKLMNYRGHGAIRLGAVVEIIHTATLVHDDIIDEARDAPRASRGQHAMGQLQVRAGRRLALHAGLQDRRAGAQFPHSRRC